MGPRRWAADVTASTVSADTPTRAPSSGSDTGARRSTAVSGRSRTKNAAAPHTTAARETTVKGPSGRALSSRVEATKAATPSVAPAATEAARGAGTSRVAAR